LFGQYACSEDTEVSGQGSPLELSHAYQKFHKSKNIDGLLSLFYSKTDNNGLFKDSFEEDIKYPILSIVINDVENRELDAWRKRGIKSDIRPIAWLKVTFEVASDVPGVSALFSQYLIGEKMGRYYIATSE